MDEIERKRLRDLGELIQLAWKMCTMNQLDHNLCPWRDKKKHCAQRPKD